MDRGTRPLNAALLTLLVTATISGVVAFGVGFPGPARWVVAVHGASGLGLLLLARSGRPMHGDDPPRGAWERTRTPRRH